MKAGRNDPCPCGSGDKYKKCCLAKEQQAHVVDFEYLRLREIEAKLIPKLIRHADEIFGESGIDEAWAWFNDDDGNEEDEGFDPEEPMNQAFIPWFLFTYTIDHPDDKTVDETPLETTVAESYLKTQARHLSTDERAIIQAANRQPWTLCEVVQVKPGVGLVVFDMLQRHQYEIIERTASRQLQPGHIILCATMLPLAGRLMNIGTAPYPLPPIAKQQVLELRREIVERCKSETLTTEMIREEDAFVIGLYLDIVGNLFNPERSFANTDGEALVPHKMMFKVESSPSTFEALKDLAAGVPESDLLARATRDADGAISKAEIPWLKLDDGTSKLGGPITLGRIMIDGLAMTVETNSKERADRLRAEIEKRLEGRATYRTTLVEPIESQLGNGGGETDATPIPYDQLPPEALALLTEMAQRHWDQWFDLPVPALNGMTPREAAKIDEGRDLLRSLLLYYEQQDERSPDNLLKADVGALRRELGLK